MYPDRRSDKITISHIRRVGVENISQRVGIVINNDGTIFDRVTKKSFNTIMEWVREVA